MQMRALFVGLLTPLSLLAQAPTAAQLREVLVPGARARVTSTAVSGRPFGGVGAVDSTTLTLVGDGGVAVRIPLASITRVESSLGRRRQTIRGMLVGVTLGLALGVIADVDRATCDEWSSTSFCSRGEALFGGTVAGAGIGAGIGAFFRSDRWATVSFPSIALRTDRPGVRVAMSVSRWSSVTQ